MLFNKLLRVTSFVHLETTAEMVVFKSAAAAAAFSIPLCKRTPSVVSVRWLSSYSPSPYFPSDMTLHVSKPNHFERKGNVVRIDGERYAPKVPSNANIPVCFRTIAFTSDTSYSFTSVILRQLHSSKSVAQVSRTRQSLLTAGPVSQTFIDQKNYSEKKPHQVSTTRQNIPSPRSFCSKGDSGQQNSTGNKDSPGGGNLGECKSPITSIPVKDGLQTRAAADDFLSHLTDDQKNLLYHSLNIDVLRDKYEGHLGSSKSESHIFLSKFGRPTAAVGTEDPTGTLCEVSPKWLHARLGKTDSFYFDNNFVYPFQFNLETCVPLFACIVIVSVSNLNLSDIVRLLCGVGVDSVEVKIDCSVEASAVRLHFLRFGQSLRVRFWIFPIRFHSCSL